MVSSVEPLRLYRIMVPGGLQYGLGSGFLLLFLYKLFSVETSEVCYIRGMKQKVSS